MLADEEMGADEIQRMIDKFKEEEQQESESKESAGEDFQKQQKQQQEKLGEQQGMDSSAADMAENDGNETSRRGRHVVERVEFEPITDDKVKKKFGMETFKEVDMKVSGELGRARIKVRDLLELDKGSVLKLDQLADENLTLLVNEAPFAYGEVVVIGDRFGVRITYFSEDEEEENN